MPFSFFGDMCVLLWHRKARTFSCIAVKETMPPRSQSREAEETARTLVRSRGASSFFGKAMSPVPRPQRGPDKLHEKIGHEQIRDRDEPDLPVEQPAEELAIPNRDVLAVVDGSDRRDGDEAEEKTPHEIARLPREELSRGRRQAHGAGSPLPVCGGTCVHRAGSWASACVAPPTSSSAARRTCAGWSVSITSTPQSIACR